jgi:hypothetical protein
MRVWLLVLAACGEADTVELDRLLPPPTREVSRDAGVEVADAATGGARADVVPGSIEFGFVYVGNHADRELSFYNRSHDFVRIEVISQPDSFFLLTPLPREMEPTSRASAVLRFAPAEPGTHDRSFEFDLCANGCVERVRVIGVAE